MKMTENMNYIKCYHPKCNKKGLYNYEKNGYSYCYQRLLVIDMFAWYLIDNIIVIVDYYWLLLLVDTIDWDY